MNLVLFDLDHTLIPFDSNTVWLDFLVRNGAVEAGDAAARNMSFARDYMAGSFDAHAFHRFAAGLLAPHPRSSLEQWRLAFGDEITAAIPAGSRELVDRHLAAGDLCSVVTATNRFLAQLFSEIFGIAHLVATDLATRDDSPDAPFTGELRGDPCFGAGKVGHVTRWLDRIGRSLSDFASTIFYSDSYNDLALLQWVDQAIVVNPDPRLRAEARARGWPVLEIASDHSTIRSAGK